MRFSLKRILLNFYFALQIFVVSMGLLCGFDSYARIDIIQENIPSGVEEVKNSIVLLQFYQGKSIIEGTGFILEDGILVTNAHFLHDIVSEINTDLSYIKIFQERQLLDAQVISIQALDPVHDLALLNIKGSEIPPPIKKPRGKLNLTKEQLFFVGYPKGKLKAMGQKGPIEIF
ncbi:MAG: S1 family peptidase, partial [Bdellovibrionales bacterium]